MKNYVISISFGKDSLAMLLRMLELPEEKNRILRVIFFDTGVEFECIYRTRDRVIELLKKENIPYVEVGPKEPFRYVMLEKEFWKKDGTKVRGRSWCGGACRWGTADKLSALKPYTENTITCVGIAADEKHRLKRGVADKSKRYPLVEWGWSEADCLAYCYQKGFYFTEQNGVRIYDVLQRCSCFCCKNKNLDELYAMYKFLPAYFEELKQMQENTWLPMKGPGKSVHELEERFKQKLELEQRQMTFEELYNLPGLG